MDLWRRSSQGRLSEVLGANFIERDAMTRRMVAAIASPHTDVLGHCTGRMLVGRGRPQSQFDHDIVIDHGDGLTTLYAHASRLLVSEGDRVDSGQAIAEVGATGNAHGTLLHFEVRRDGLPVDPLPYFKPEIIGPSAR